MMAFKTSRRRLQMTAKWKCYLRHASAIGRYHRHSTSQVVLLTFQDEAATGHRMRPPLEPHLQLPLDVSAPVPSLARHGRCSRKRWRHGNSAVYMADRFLVAILQ